MSGFYSDPLETAAGALNAHSGGGFVPDFDFLNVDEESQMPVAGESYCDSADFRKVCKLVESYSDRFAAWVEKNAPAIEAISKAGLSEIYRDKAEELRVALNDFLSSKNRKLHHAFEVIERGSMFCFQVVFPLANHVEFCGEVYSDFAIELGFDPAGPHVFDDSFITDGQMEFTRVPGDSPHIEISGPNMPDWVVFNVGFLPVGRHEICLSQNTPTLFNQLFKEAFPQMRQPRDSAEFALPAYNEFNSPSTVGLVSPVSGETRVLKQYE